MVPNHIGYDFIGQSFIHFNINHYVNILKFFHLAATVKVVLEFSKTPK